MAYSILVVDDDEDVAETIERTLRRANYEVRVAYRGADAMEIARREHPDLIVLDIMMPGMSGIEVCRHLRANPRFLSTPILFLTAKGEIADKIEGFEAGADDYLTKPFDLRELELRVRALLRRSHPDQMEVPPERIEVGPLVLDCQTYELITPDRKVLLTPVEFELLRFLMSNPGKVFSAEKLLQQVWGYPPGTGMPDLVRVHIKNIREKIEPSPRNPRYLKNILRHGYTIRPYD
ncbi:response regulator transcription factor [Candidatus Sumerlaeota bacterium]|nr:response regulator transcription factor [Candidatus Sumerlaeota bacterium]